MCQKGIRIPRRKPVIPRARRAQFSSRQNHIFFRTLTPVERYGVIKTGAEEPRFSPTISVQRRSAATVLRGLLSADTSPEPLPNESSSESTRSRTGRMAWHPENLSGWVSKLTAAAMDARRCRCYTAQTDGSAILLSRSLNR